MKLQYIVVMSVLTTADPGEPDYVLVPHATNLNPGSQITIMAWINPAVSPAAVSMRVVDKITAGGGDGYLLDTHSGVVRLIIGPTNLFGLTAVPANALTHIVGTYDGATMKVYRNGVLDGSLSLASPIPTNTLPLFIGASQSGGTVFSQFFNGLMDEVAIFDRALSASEIQAIFAAGSAGKCKSQPDLLIKAGDEPDSAFAINDEYQTIPSGDQIETQLVAEGETATYQVKVKNDSTDSTEHKTFVVKATESSESGWTVTYKVGATNITGQITGSGGYTTSGLVPGGSEIITVEMTPPSTASGTSKITTIQAFLDENDTTVQDAVQAITTVSGGVPPPTTPSSKQTGKSTEVGDPIDASSGEFYFNMPLFNLDGSLPLRYTIFYRVQQLSSGAFGSRFDHNIPRLTLQGAQALILAFGDDDNQLFFNQDASGNWQVETGVSIPYVLKETANSFYLMDPVSERVYFFEKGSLHTRLRWVRDRNGNQLTYTYDGDSDRVIQISDGLGRSLSLTYDANNHVSSVTDQGGRTVAFTYSGSQLISVTDALGQTTTFEYDPANSEAIVKRILPRGNAPFTQAYGLETLNGSSDLRVTSQSDALGNTTTLAYDAAVNEVTETRPDGTQVTYEHQHNNGLPKAITDPTGNQATFTQTTQEQLSGITDRMDSTTSLYLPYRERQAGLPDQCQRGYPHQYLHLPGPDLHQPHKRRAGYFYLL